MKLTNELGLPQPIVDAVANDDYDAGDCDISVTRLIDPPQKVALIALHGDEIVEDVSDRMWALMGQAIHTILERAASTGGIAEDRLFATIEGWRISGKFDYLSLVDDAEHGRILSDYKIASVWEAIHGIKPERVAQLNILRWLAVRHGYRVDRLEAVFIFRDWQKTKAAFDDGDYPKRQTMRYFVPMWSDEKVLEYLIERVRLHQAAARGDVAPCTGYAEDRDGGERWEKPTKYALMKKDRKSAVRVLSSRADVEAFAVLKGNAMIDPADGSASLKSGYSIEKRKGENTRCEYYCAAAQFCPQFAAIKAAEEEVAAA